MTGDGGKMFGTPAASQGDGDNEDVVVSVSVGGDDRVDSGSDVVVVGVFCR